MNDYENITKNYNSDDFFERVKQLIKSNSNSTLRDFIKDCGLNPENYYYLRKLGNFPRCDDAQRIAAGLGVSLDYLVTGEVRETGLFPYDEKIRNFVDDMLSLKDDQREMLLATFSAQVKYFQDLNEKKD